jgi:hypothetical protein
MKWHRDRVITAILLMWSALTLLRRERRGQPAQPPKRRRLDGSEGKLKASGDLGLGVATQVGQREHLALLLGQVAERVVELTRFRGHVGYAADAGDRCCCS